LKNFPHSNAVGWCCLAWFAEAKYSNRRRWDPGEWNVSTFFKFDVGDCQINIWRDVEDKLVNHAKKVEMTT